MADITQETDVVLNKYGAVINAKLKEYVLSKDLTGLGPVYASGKLYNSIRYEVRTGVLRVYALNYIYFLEYGRKPGKFPPFDASSTKYGIKKRGSNKGKPRGDFPNISFWMENKPAAQARFQWNILQDWEKSSLIYLLSRKLSKSGSLIYQKYNPGGSNLVAGILTPELKKELNSELLISVIEVIKEKIRLFGREI